MGSTESSYQQRFHNKYNFITQVHDKNYGLVKVYRKREVNFDYVMILERLVAGSHLEEAREELEEVKRSFSKERQPMLLRVFNVQTFQKASCGAYGVRVYVEYLNYSLKDQIEQKKANFQCFSIQEIVYILNCAIQTYSLFTQLQHNYLVLRAETIFITLQGFLRFSPVRVLDFQQQEELENCDCMMEPPVQNFFQKSERQFLIEVKNLLHELVAICPRNDQNFVKSYEMLSNVNHSRTIASLKGLLWEPSIESLNIAKKGPESTEISTVREPLTGSFQQSAAKSKLSLKESQAQFLK